MLKNTLLPIYTMRCEKYIPNCLKFHPEDQILYVGTQNGEILIWCLETHRLKNATKTGTECMIAIELSMKQKKLVSQNNVGKINFWRINGMELILHHILSINVIGLCKMALYKTNMLLCKAENNKILCYSIETYNKVIVFNPKKNNSLGDLMVIKSTVDYVFCGYESNTIIVWKEDNNIVGQYTFPEIECLMALDVDQNVTKGVCAGSSNMINTFCITEGVLCLNKSIEITNPGVSVLQLRPDDKIVAAACWDITVRLFSWKTMKLLAVLDSHSTGVYNIIYSESPVTFWKTRYMLAVANKDNKITLWNLYDKKDT